MASSTPEYFTPGGYSTPGVVTLVEGLRQMLTRESSAHRMVASLIVGYWGACPNNLRDLLTNLLTQRTTYEEIVPYLATMQRECHVRTLLKILLLYVCL